MQRHLYIKVQSELKEGSLKDLVLRLDLCVFFPLKGEWLFFWLLATLLLSQDWHLIRALNDTLFTSKKIIKDEIIRCLNSGQEKIKYFDKERSSASLNVMICWYNHLLIWYIIRYLDMMQMSQLFHYFHYQNDLKCQKLTRFLTTDHVDHHRNHQMCKNLLWKVLLSRIYTSNSWFLAAPLLSQNMHSVRKARQGQSFIF